MSAATLTSAPRGGATLGNPGATVCVAATTAPNEGWRKNLRGGENDTELCQAQPPSWFFTGRKPSELAAQQAPGVEIVDGRVVMRSAPMPTLPVSRKELLAYFDNTWTLTELVFSALVGEEAYYRPPYHHLRHPMIFYYGHPAVFYVNKLRLSKAVDIPVNRDFELLFEVGVDEMQWDDMNKNESEWPQVREVAEYRRKVYDIVRHVIETHPEVGQGDVVNPHRNSVVWALLMAMEHERIHIETSSVLIRELPINLVRTPREWPALYRLEEQMSEPRPGVEYPQNELLTVLSHATTVELGKPDSFPNFGWDCDYGHRTERVSAFQASKYKISNGEYFEFVAAGGYYSQKYWSEKGWAWRTFRNTRLPTFWVTDGPAGLHSYRLRTPFAIVPMQWSWPVIVNYHEAKAYCAWRSEQDGKLYRPLSEAEHAVMAGVNRREATVAQEPVTQYSGIDIAERTGYNVQLAFGAETPVNALAANAAGFHDVFGNVWEWSDTLVAPLDGYRSNPLYMDFSQPCMDGMHELIVGGSFVSTGNEASVFARYHFRQHFFQHAGFRLSLPMEDECDEVDFYEQQSVLHEYLTFHYPPSFAYVFPYAASMPGVEAAFEFPRRIAEKVVQVAEQHGVSMERALDVGCAVGRSCFEMARKFQRVVGVDLSQSFITACQHLQQEGTMEFDSRLEGVIFDRLTAHVAPEIDRTRLEFEVGDACALRADLGPFDAVLLANLICRLPEPMACLTRMASMVRSGGVLVITTPFTWMEQFTAQDKWLGARVINGERVRSLDALKQALSPNFELLEEAPFPMLIREHVRKFQLTFPTLTVWKRR